ncbi:short-chain dehydrogenases/reductase [Aspergillus luchuensis]|uniref:Short-chain dehydrogenases/reductase n=1 Tax=Aspergillus kawachii TaxID=1069201 RepID=A0A146FVM0_ASPKA|nr:short-chain dehydrogenases/reductase [Aspergillus luchuensis]
MAKTIVATGISSGLGFETIKQLLEQAEPYNFILGARDTAKVQAAYDGLNYDTSKHSITIYPLDLLSLKSVQSFAANVLSKLGSEKLAYLFLCAGTLDNGEGPGPNGSQWCSGYVVNHLATLDVDLKANSGAGYRPIYSASKFVQLLGAFYWRRELPSCTVVAVSPGLIPSTPLASSMGLTMDMPDAKTIPEGAQNLLRAFFINDFPADPEQIFLTSWGEWWPKDVYALALDADLQKKWCLSREEIEKTESIA